ncbi:MAG: hypothetical protein IIW67_00070 [Peptococcaceae bacterium]|jgi:hypothetical protein|nr:hypothetical protein [Peptococcaceae bacterium]MBQ2003715.1 hypothetical protein [Peptococcaceae bacterium]MBQ2021042.1 hypothetical protein [Peptococcaceae bacterium]MBQ2369834.1 hypothetical protein [Peptococcaceae bacterium]MBQ2431982.1 hypothetical protein [Peptococcaceae bacterium]
MRILLLFIAALLSCGIVYLAYLSLSEQIGILVYTLVSSGISILLIFALFHFIYLYISKKK